LAGDLRVLEDGFKFSKYHSDVGEEAVIYKGFDRPSLLKSPE